ncbi:probable serine/threonine-protein kinase roco9, partial [Hyposmocoma kahamanoa]|uniref:probable serine/threonine-protein kinase roco9 n=1 Tax=Hyposmocoma kahamanoa TaxID=1477025 RepID=UPI000E6DA242
ESRYCKNFFFSGPPRAVQLGSSYLDDSGALVVRVAAVVRHPKYKSPRSYYDVALLKLRHPVTFSQVIKPACLGVPPPVNEPIIATGWGRTEFSDQSLELRSVSLPIWDINKCAEVLGTSRKLPNGPSSDSQVCAGEMRGRKDTCQGDSGGPAQIQDGCIWRVVAITSLGRSCGAPNTPGLYAKVPIAFVAAQVFGNYKSTPTTEMNYQNNYNNNQQGHNNDQQEYYNKNQQGYNSNQNYQNYNQQQNNYNNNQRRDNRNDDSNYNYQTSTNKVYRSDENNYNNQNYNYNNARRDEAGTFKNHRNVDVYTATNPNNNQGYNENDRNYNTDVNAYSNQQNYENNYNNNHRRDYRNYNNQNDYNYNNRNGDYNRNVNQQSYNVRDIGSDNSRIWIT